MTYSDRLRQLLALVLDLELAVRELDRISTLGEGHCGQLLAGTKGLGWGTADKLAATLGCTPEWLLAGRGAAPGAEAVRLAVLAARAAHEARKSAQAQAKRKLSARTASASRRASKVRRPRVSARA